MAWFAHESFERPNTFSRGDTLDFFQELGEGAKEMLRNQKLNAGEEKDKEKDGKDSNKEKKKEKKEKEDNLKTSKDQITRKKPSTSSSDDAAFSAYVKDLERKEKMELEASSRKRGETSVSAKELRAPKIQFSEAEETTPAGAPRVASDDKLKMNKNSRAWNSFGNIGGIDRIRSLRQGKVEASDKEKEKEKEKEREKAEKEREKAEKAEKEKGDPPPKSPRKEKNHDRAPSWGSSSVNSFTSSGTFKVPAMRSTSDSHVGDLDNSSGGESSGGEKKTPSPRIRVGESFESPTPSPKGGRTKSDRKERDAPPVHKACLAKDSVTVRQLVEDSIKHRKLKQLLFDRDSKGRTPLHVAAETKGCIGILSLILSLASDDLKGKYLQRFLNSADPIGRTALHSAASQGLISHCQLLLRYGADGSVQVEPDKTTVLHHLATCKPIPDNSENEDKVRTLVRLLLESGVDINAKSYPSGETCLHLAARSGNKLVFEILVDFGADIQLLTAANENCIHYAAKGGHPDMIDFLLSIELDSTQEGKNGKPESVAKSEEVIQILKRHAEALKYRSGELDRPLPPSPTSSQEIRTKKALYKP